MKLGLSLGLSQQQRAANAPAFDPSSLPLTGWWRASYAGSPWVGTASAGTSAGRNLSEATNPPSVGAAVNGFTPADFDGTNDIFAGVASNTFYSTTAYSMSALIFVDAFTRTDPGAAAPSGCPQVCGDSNGNGAPCGGPVGTGSSGVFRFGHFDGGWKSAAEAISTGVWVMVKVRYNGTSIQVGTNGNPFAPGTAAGTITNINGVLRFGRNFGGTAFFDGKVLEAMTADVALTDQNFSDILAHYTARYALSL